MIWILKWVATILYWCCKYELTVSYLGWRVGRPWERWYIAATNIELEVTDKFLTISPLSSVTKCVATGLQSSVGGAISVMDYANLISHFDRGLGEIAWRFHLKCSQTEETKTILNKGQP